MSTLSPNPIGNVQAAAVANEMAKERCGMMVQFPITGDPETDIICGVLSVVESQTAKLPGPEAVARALRYLSDRYQELAQQKKREMELEKAWQEQQQLAQGWLDSTKAVGQSSAGSSAAPSPHWSHSSSGGLPGL